MTNKDQKKNPSAKAGESNKGEAEPTPDNSFNPDYPGSWVESAKQTLDLWEQQISSGLADPYWVDQWGLFLHNFQNAAAQRNAKATQTAASDLKQHSKAADHEQSPAKPQAAGLSSEQRLDYVEELAKRLQELEKRVAILEQSAAPTSVKRTSKSSKRPS